MTNLMIFHKGGLYYPNLYKNFVSSGDKIVFYNTKDDKTEVNLADCDFTTSESRERNEDYHELYNIVHHPDVIQACEDAGLNIDVKGVRIAHGRTEPSEITHETVVNEYHESGGGFDAAINIATGMFLGKALFEW
jgi:hypothetical protein